MDDVDSIWTEKGLKEAGTVRAVDDLAWYPERSADFERELYGDGESWCVIYDDSESRDAWMVADGEESFVGLTDVR